MEEKVEIENLCPMIAMISAGKTSILRVFFDIDFLEATAGIGTKFVNIIRYNPEVGDKPKFYHLKLKSIDKGNYEFYKDGPVIIGKEEIKKKNEELNKQYKLNPNVPYEELFYMVEIGEANFFEDKEYLKHYDLVDIPGVNEYNPDELPKTNEKPSDIKKENLPPANPFFQDFMRPTENKNQDLNIYESMEEEMLNYNPKNEKNYLTEIFRIIKNKTKNGIIVFSVDNYQHAENYRIIAKLQIVLNKPIENFLILLNKIDKSENREYDLNTLNSKILKYFPSCKQFNPTKNHIFACSKIQLENESKMRKSFYHLLYYHFLNYLMYVNNIISGAITTCGFNYIDFLKKINNTQTIKKKKLLEIITQIKNEKNYTKILEEIKDIINHLKESHQAENLNLGIREDDFHENEIKKVLENLKNEEKNGEEEEEEERDDTLKIEDLEGNIIILYYYSEFKKQKNIPPLSADTQNIMDYFTMKNMNKNVDEDLKIIIDDDKKKIKEEKNRDKKIDNISEGLMKFYEEYKKQGVKQYNLDRLKRYINSSVGILKTSKLLYIPMLGVSNAGKSTILNGIIGKKILPAQKNECTKKGILIRHWDKNYAVIRKTRFKIKNFEKKRFNENDKDNIYYFEPEEDIITAGIENIHRVLEGTNGEFTKKEEDFFYEIDINIKFVNDLKIEESLKEKICFIDLPGFGTNNEFERKGVYSHLMKSCNIFLFVVFNLKIRENTNQKMLDELYRQMSMYRGIPVQAFIKKCLFIVNCDKDQDMSEKSIIQAKNDIISVVKGLDKSNFNDLNICFFNAKFYENYILKLLYYGSVENLMKYEYGEYRKSKENKLKGLIEKIKGGTFSKYLKEQLKDNIKTDIADKFDQDNINADKNIFESVKNFNIDKQLKLNEDDIKLIAKYITFGRENLPKSDLLPKSNIDYFAKDLLISINKAKLKEDEDINMNLKLCFKILDDIFEVDPNTKYGLCRDAPVAKVVKPHIQEDLNTMLTEISNLLSLLRNEFANNDIAKLLASRSSKISVSLTEQKSQIRTNLEKKNWDKVQEQFEITFKKETNGLKDELLSTLEKSSKNIEKYLNQCYDLLDKFYSNKIERQKLLFKTHICNCLGGDNDITKIIDQLINDIITGSKTAADNTNGFFDWLSTKFSNETYLNKIIDYMISQSLPKIKSFSDKIGTEAESFKTKIIDTIESSKNRVKEELDQKKLEEESAIREAKIKNEEEKKKWEEEKRALEAQKSVWEKLCKKYRALRDEIIGLRLAKDNSETSTG